MQMAPQKHIFVTMSFHVALQGHEAGFDVWQMCVQLLGFRVKGLGFRVKGLGLRV